MGRVSKKSYLITILTCLAFESLALAQVDTAWVSRYNGPGDSVDIALALAVDDSANVIVTGRSTGLEFLDMATIKYSPSGDTVWVRRYDHTGVNSPNLDFESAYSLVVDKSNNIYVGGAYQDWPASANYVIIKYSPAGGTLWTRMYPAPGNFYSFSLKLAMDDSGNVYLAGAGIGGSSPVDHLVVKYKPNGDSAWSRKYNGPGNLEDWATDLDVDDSGNVYLCGTSRGSDSDYDFTTIKFSPAGDTLWVRRYNGPGNGFDFATAVGVDDSGNVYVTGYGLGIGSSDDIITIKYSPIGDTLWARTYDSPSNGFDQTNALVVDDSGNVYITGQSHGNNADYVTIKYSSAGDSLWVKRYNGPGFSWDQALDMVLDQAGNVYVTGESYGGLSSVDDYATVKYSSTGEILWVQRYNGTGNSNDRAGTIVTDDSGNVYVTGYSSGSGTDYDYLTIKYEPLNCAAIPGDANASGDHTLADVVSIVNYTFSKTGFPACTSNSTLCWLSDLLCRGDWDASTTVTLADAIRAVNKLFNKPGGPWDALPVGVCCVTP